MSHDARKHRGDHSPTQREQATEVDLFHDPPFDFARAYDAAVPFQVAPGVAGTFVGLADLVTMKRAAGRPLDLEDVKRLLELHAENEHA